MYTTYKLMANCTNSTYLNMNLEDLCESYKKTESVTKRNKIVAAMFCKVYPMVLDIQKKYYSNIKYILQMQRIIERKNK